MPHSALNIMKVAVVIPVYKTEINKFETVSLDSIRRFLGSYDIIFVEPKGLITSYILTNEKTVSFSEHFFSTIDGYNRLLTSSSFYKAFEAYDYLLIAQLDTFVFKNELVDWCQKGYDYVGAPWTYELSEYAHLKELLPFMHRGRKFKIFRKFTQREYLVGNGGFSLRKIKSFIHILSIYEKALDDFRKVMSEWKMKGVDVAFNEDVFWALYVPKVHKEFKIAPFKEALKFAFEVNPRYCFKKNSYRLPFGCHGWEKHGLNFWKPILKKYGYEI